MKPYIEMKVPAKFKYSPASAAEFLEMSISSVRRRLKLPSTDQEYIKSHKNGKNNSMVTIYAYDLEDYLKRTETGNGYRGEKPQKAA